MTGPDASSDIRDRERECVSRDGQLAAASKTRLRRTVSLRVVVAVAGFAALVVMHGVTFPTGHLAASDLAAPAASMMSAMVSPMSDDASGHHGVSHSSHGDGATACVAAAMTVLAVLIAARSTLRRTVAPIGWPTGFVAGPEPPVPRTRPR